MKKHIFILAAFTFTSALFAGFPEDFRAAQQDFNRSKWKSAAEKFLKLEKSAKGEVKDKVLSYAAIASAHAKKVNDANNIVKRISNANRKAYTQLQILSATQKFKQIEKEFAAVDISKWSEEYAYRGYFTRGQAYFRLRKFKAAVSDLEKAIADAGSDTRLKIIALDLAVASAKYAKDTAKALALADQAIKITSYRNFYAYMSPYLTKVQILIEQKKFADAEKALAAFNKGRNWKNGGYWCYRYLDTCGNLAFAKGDKAKALEFYKQAYNTKNVPAYYKNQMKNKVNKTWKGAL